MVKAIKKASLILILALLLVTLPSSVKAQTPGVKYEPETGHYIRGPFLEFYENAPEASRLFGYPITEEFYDPNLGYTVQYFQRARLDLLTTGVEVAPLGSLLHEGTAELANIPTNSAMCRRFPETGKSICYAFLQFYDNNQGSIYFGTPVSDLEKREGGRLTQYFEKARMEWWPERPAGERVVLTDLGRIYFDSQVGDPQLLKRVDPDTRIIDSPQNIEVHAFVKNVLLSVDDTQLLYIIVQDENLNPIEGATPLVLVKYPNGKEEQFRPNPTNADGISELTFTVLNDLEIQDMVEVDVTASYLASTEDTSSWFRIWW